MMAGSGQPGSNRIAVWAEDNAPTGPNSGHLQPEPYQLTTTVISDRSVPTVAYNPNFASYRDERGMTVAVDAAAAKIFGVNPQDIPHIAYAEQMGLGKTALETMNIKRIIL